MGILFSSNAFSTPICTKPVAPPPLKTKPIFCWEWNWSTTPHKKKKNKMVRIPFKVCSFVQKYAQYSVNGKTDSRK
jgi:hypothetical protein